jgi:hypothetical protein
MKEKEKTREESMLRLNTKYSEDERKGKTKRICL